MRLWPTTLLGLAGAGVAAIAGHQAWISVHANAGTIAGATGLDRPEVTSVGLATLALWGVLLVTRGRVRRIVAVAALVAGVALTAFAVHGVTASAHAEFAWISSSSKPPTTSRSAWGPLAVAGAALAAIAALLAVRWSPGWPEMGKKYDAPVGGPSPSVPLEERDAIDVWKAMDQGVDPTLDRSE